MLLSGWTASLNCVHDSCLPGWIIGRWLWCVCVCVCRPLAFAQLECSPLHKDKSHILLACSLLPLISHTMWSSEGSPVGNVLLAPYPSSRLSASFLKPGIQNRTWYSGCSSACLAGSTLQTRLGKSWCYFCRVAKKLVMGVESAVPVSSVKPALQNGAFH